MRARADYDAAAASHQEALEQFRELGQIDGLAMASNDVGLVQQGTGYYQSVASHLEALAIYVHYGRRPGKAEVLNNLGDLYARIGDSARARDHHTRALRIACALPAPLEEA